MIHGMSGPTRAHLYVTQINSPIFHFIGIVELNHVFTMFENRFEIEILKIGSLKIENFEMKFKFENFELGFWKFDLEIKELSFINLRLRNLSF